MVKWCQGEVARIKCWKCGVLQKIEVEMKILLWVVWDYQRTSKVDPNDRHDKHWPFNNFNIFFITY